MTEPRAELKAASVFYGEVVGLSRLDFEFGAGITGIVGPNGSGKSTLMRTLAGLIEPQEGSVRVLGGTPFRDASIRASIALVPATEAFHRDLSGRRNLELAFLARGLSWREARRLAQAGLETAGLLQDAHRSFGSWSRGMRQRLKLGLALSEDSSLVLLDEPFLGVDPPTRHALKEIVLQLGAAGRAVLVSSHVLSEIESLTDRVGVLARGRLLGYGRIGELLHSLRDRHPHRIRVICSDARRLAGALVALPHILETRLPHRPEEAGRSELEVVSSEPSRAYRDLARVASEADVLMLRVEPLDHDLEAVFRYVTSAGVRRL